MVLYQGICPESGLQGREVALRLNLDGFWESPATGVQVVLQPPWAVVLRWRGAAQWTQPIQYAAMPESPLHFCKACHQEGMELQPQEDAPLDDPLELQWYLHQLCDSREAFMARQFQLRDPVFTQQENHLRQLRTDQWQLLFETYQTFTNSGIRFNIRRAPAWRLLEQYLRQLGIIFSFKWQSWQQGWNHIRDIRYPYGRSSMLELSMYLSAIFLSEPYDEGTIEFYYTNKTIERILKALQQQVCPVVEEEGY